MIRHIFLLMIMIVISLTACNDQWDEHIDSSKSDDSVLQDVSLVDYIKLDSSYSMFYSAMEESSFIDSLSSNKFYTFWILKNDKMPDLAQYTDSLLFLFVSNHVSELPILKSDFNTEKRITFLSSKQLNMTASTSGNFMLENATIVNTDIRCLNGVVHELDTQIIPMKNILEEINTNPEYKVMSELLKSFTRNVFKPELSAQVDIDDDGNIIYDSVFVWENRILLENNIADEAELFTLCIATNSVLEPRIKQMYIDFESVIGRTANKEDSITLESWILESMIFSGMITDFGSKEDWYSVYEELWKTSYQKMNPNYLHCSNGLIYEVESLHIPSRLMMRSVKNDINRLVVMNDGIFPSPGLYPKNFHSSVKITVSRGDLDFFASKQVIGGFDYFQFRGRSKVDNKHIIDHDFRIVWPTFDDNRTDEIVPISMLPGEYKVICEYAKATPNVNLNDIHVLVNQIPVGVISNIGGVETPLRQKQSIDLGIVVIEEKFGTAPVNICFSSPEAKGTTNLLLNRIICPISIELIPTDNNY